MSRATTSPAPADLPAQPTRTGCRSIRGSGSASGSTARSRAAARPTRRSTIRCSGSARSGRRPTGSTISTRRSCRGWPTMPSRACRCCRPRRSSKWRWRRRPDGHAIEVADVELRRPLPFDKGRPRELRSLEAGEDGDWELSSRPRLSDEPPTLHAVARLITPGECQPAPLFAAAKPGRGQVDAALLYRLAAQLGLDYGPQFRAVTGIELLGSNEASAQLDASVIDEPLDPYVIHPALLDGALQALLALIADRDADLGGASFLPWRFGRVRVTAPFGRLPASARVRVTRLGTRSVSADIALFDPGGALVG